MRHSLSDHQVRKHSLESGDTCSTLPRLPVRRHTSYASNLLFPRALDLAPANVLKYPAGILKRNLSGGAFVWLYRSPACRLTTNSNFIRIFTRGKRIFMSLRSIGCWLLAITQLFLPMAGQAQEAATPASVRISGYGTQSAAAEGAREKQFRDAVAADNIRENMRRLSARPHHVGSPYDKDNAEWILARFKEWGFDAHIESFNVLFPTPKDRVVELLGPAPFRAKLQEPAVGVDPTSDQTSEQLPTYNAYSADGDVTAPLVYVNYGIREDYEQLDRLGISVAGAIVIARYGAGWRGTKPKVAAEHGAVGCIIYSDPEGDGYHRGDEYPAGGWRPREGVQRGSVMDTDYPGDPLTPGVGATADAKRLAIKEVTTITKIPVLPISDADALPLLSALSGTVAPEDWRGALPITYHIGPGAGESAPEGRLQLGHQTNLRRDRDDPRIGSRRSVGASRQPS